jgi:hypothetical protein
MSAPAPAIRVAVITDTVTGRIGITAILTGITDIGTGPTPITATGTTGTDTGRATPIAGGTDWRCFCSDGTRRQSAALGSKRAARLLPLLF